MPPPVALTIAGSDPSGGAGLQADLKTFHRHGAYGTSVVTLVTVQNTRRVSAVEILAPDLVVAQLDAVLDDIPPAAAKTGALGSAAVITAVAARLRGTTFPLVVDPVMVSKHGAALIADDAVRALVARALVADLLPRATLVTPNLPEAERLAGFPVGDVAAMERAARAIAALGPPHVLVKGGHLDGAAVDVLLSEGRVTTFSAARIDTRHTHGTGCTLSAAITARLAAGEPVATAVAGGCRFIRAAIAGAPGLGGGCGPVDHFADPG
ncbi:MAG: bifunctional hydroxymethylpyrimidine kinase/phosphomethylpyrimidine kinase [Planctomycetia bacterium]|nr:bifunctional hydroxymethylpyrimidine kinase/phosphomethylpyrimidine kinase [Planctomycetia bacterium]